MIEFSTDQAFAAEMDSRDPLARFRENFYIPGDVIYMLGKDTTCRRLRQAVNKFVR